MKKILIFLVRFCKDVIEFCLFLVDFIVFGRFSDILKYNKNIHTNQRLAVIATGPSLKNETAYIEKESYIKSTDFLMLNFSAFDSLFFKLRPKHYCLADPMYFHSSWRDEEVFRFYKLINEKVDWEMTIYVPALNFNSFVNFSKLTNKHIKIKKVNRIRYSGFNRLRFFFYRKGLASVGFQTVTNMAIFIGIQNGYPNIDLFGVDHTFLADLKINDKNQLCQKYAHSYDDGIPQYKVLFKTETNEVWKIGDYIIACGNMFVMHDLLELYAKSLGCRIVNHTVCSMIDSYERYSN